MWKSVLRLFLISLVVAAPSCAPRQITTPAIEARSPEAVRSELSSVRSINAVFSIAIKDDHTVTEGEAAMQLTRSGDLSLRVYSMGFPVFDLESEDGEITSSRSMSDEHKLSLARGLRQGFFWWDIDGPLRMEEGCYTLTGEGRRLWIDLQTGLPTRQLIATETNLLMLSYDSPARNEDGIWYPSKIAMDLPPYRVTLQIEKITYIRDPLSGH